MSKSADNDAQSPSTVVRFPDVLEMADRLARRAGRPLARFFLKVEARTRAFVPLVSSSVQAGFPSPADDYLDRPLDFNELLITNPAATFAVRVDGNSMIGVGIHHGDIAVVDRSLPVRDRVIVVAMVDGEFFIKRYRNRGGRVWLQAENPTFPDTPITEETTFEVVGVVEKTIRLVGTR